MISIYRSVKNKQVSVFVHDGTSGHGHTQPRKQKLPPHNYEQAWLILPPQTLQRDNRPLWQRKEIAWELSNISLS